MLGQVRVLDLCSEEGLFCGKMFSDFGADVIKVERIGGDPARRLGPFFHNIADPEKSLFWFAYNTGKRGITLNLETRQGQEIFKKLCKTADVVIESFSPGYLEVLGLGYDSLCRIHPGIIMTSITPFGQSGPYRHFKSPDLISIAMGGIMSLGGDPDRAPLRASVEQSYTQAGAQAAAASMIAFHYRQLSGEGQHIDFSIQECILQITLAEQQYWEWLGIIQKREGTKVPRGAISPTAIYPCKDGYISWRLFVAQYGSLTRATVNLMKDWGEDVEALVGVAWEKLDMNSLKQSELEKWEASFTQFFKKHPAAKLYGEGIKRGIWLFPVNDPKDILDDKQLRARDFWVNLEHPELQASIIYPGIPFKSSAVDLTIKSRAPMIGEHNEEIYCGELGMSRSDLARLKEGGVI